LQVFERDLLRSIHRIVEFNHSNTARAGTVNIHSGGREIKSWPQLFGISNIHPGAISSELGIGASEFKFGKLAHGTPSAIAAHEPFTRKGLIASLNSNSVTVLRKPCESLPALDFNAQLRSPLGE